MGLGRQNHISSAPIPSVVVGAALVTLACRFAASDHVTDLRVSVAVLFLATALLIDRQIARRSSAALHSAIDWAVLTVVVVALILVRVQFIEARSDDVFPFAAPDPLIVVLYIAAMITSLTTGSRLVGPLLEQLESRRAATLLIVGMGIAISSCSVASMPLILLAESNTGRLTLIGVALCGQALWALCLWRLDRLVPNSRIVLAVHLAAQLHFLSYFYALLTAKWPTLNTTTVVLLGLLAIAARCDHVHADQPHTHDGRTQRQVAVAAVATAMLVPGTIWMYAYGSDMAWAAAAAMALCICSMGVILVIATTDRQSADNEIPPPTEPLALHFQPIVRPNDGKVVGAEALLRTRNDTGASIPAPHVVERLGHHESHDVVTDFILAQTFREGVSLLDACRDPDTFISLNLSPAEIVRPDLIERVERALTTCGCTPTGFAIEVTEQGSPATSTVEFRERLHRLQQLGFLMILDDFGAGLANLTALSAFEFDIIKLDKSLLRAAAHPRGEQLLGRAIDLAVSTGAQVVVEGAETDSDLDLLGRHQQVFAQGYLFGPPRPMLDLVHDLSVV